MKTTPRTWVFVLLVTLGLSACNDGCRKGAENLIDQFAATFGQVVTVPQSD